MRPLEEKYRSMRPRPNLGRPSGGLLLLTESQLDGPDAVRRLRESGLDGGFKYRQRMCFCVEHIILYRNDAAVRKGEIQIFQRFTQEECLLLVFKPYGDGVHVKNGSIAAVL